ncbi:MAG: inositol monophosphatase [Marinosulfonomonas sp.]|nr:MAG: inositol monophosphatase [Marinosulfonomonas sp.]
MDVSCDAKLEERYEFARTLARQVGQEALRFWNENGPQGLGTQTKGLQDFVTVADKAAEDTIRSELARMFPQDGFVGEETGGAPGSAGYWVVDPIDGTANYLRGLRHWGVSIAYVEGGKTQLGIVHDSPTDRLYHAHLGHGAYCDDQPIKVAPTTDPHAAMGILGASRRVPIESYLGQIKSLYDAGVEHRKIGSAAIGIVRVAEGVADFYYEEHLNSWDALAAILIAQEAGGVAHVPQMDEFVANGGPVFCATPALADLVFNLLQPVQNQTS